MVEYRPAPPKRATPAPTSISCVSRERDGTAESSLSIIVPVYNEVRTVRAVIDRLLAIDLPVAA